MSLSLSILLQDSLSFLCAEDKWTLCSIHIQCLLGSHERSSVKIIITTNFSLFLPHGLYNGISKTQLLFHFLLKATCCTLPPQLRRQNSHYPKDSLCVLVFLPEMHFPLLFSQKMPIQPLWPGLNLTFSVDSFWNLADTPCPQIPVRFPPTGPHDSVHYSVNIEHVLICFQFCFPC